MYGSKGPPSRWRAPDKQRLPTACFVVSACMQDGVTETVPPSVILHAADLIQEGKHKEAEQYMWDSRRKAANKAGK